MPGHTTHPTDRSTGRPHLERFELPTAPGTQISVACTCGIGIGIGIGIDHDNAARVDAAAPVPVPRNVAHFRAHHH